MMSYTDKAVTMFRTSPYVWFSAVELSHQLGLCGWRTRVSDARKRGLHIENKQIHSADTGRILSFYQYIPGGTNALRRT
jgi:hypothetical protein